MKKILNMGLTIEVGPGMEVTILSPSAEDWTYIEDAYQRIIAMEDTATLDEMRTTMRNAIVRCDLNDWNRADCLAVPQGFSDMANIAIMSIYDETNIPTIDLHASALN